MGLFRRILVAFDGSPGSERALLLAVQLAGEHGAELVIISVVEHLPRFAGTVGEVDESVRERAEALRQQQERAVQIAQEHADLLALGRSGHSEVWGRFMGSTAGKIARHAPCSVLIAH